MSNAFCGDPTCGQCAKVRRVVNAVARERVRQDELKAAGRFKYTCADRELSHAERLTVLGEEFGEVCHEVNESIGGHAQLDRAKLRKELVQVAAVAVAWIEALDAEDAA